MPRSGSRAKAKRTSTSTAKGTIWPIPTRDRHSMRRSLPATSRASASTLDPDRADGGATVVADLAAGDGDRAGRQALGPVELVAGEYRKSVAYGKSESVRVALGGSRIL